MARLRIPLLLLQMTVDRCFYDQPIISLNNSPLSSSEDGKWKCELNSLFSFSPFIPLFHRDLGFHFRFQLFPLLGSCYSGYDIIEWILDYADRLDLWWADISLHVTSLVSSKRTYLIGRSFSSTSNCVRSIRSIISPLPSSSEWSIFGDEREERGRTVYSISNYLSKHCMFIRQFVRFV